MNKFDALDKIKETWNDSKIKLGDKVLIISECFYASGLNLATTAAYIKATPVELDSFLALGCLEDDLITMISEVNPPKTTWTMLANASDDEIRQALQALKGKGKNTDQAHYTFSEFVYQTMLEVSGPTVEQKVGNISGDDLKHILKKGEDFGALTDWEIKFLKSVSAQKKKGKFLSDKQVVYLIKILNKMIEQKVVVKESIDGDQEICDRIFEALGV